MSIFLDIYCRAFQRIFQYNFRNLLKYFSDFKDYHKFFYNIVYKLSEIFRDFQCDNKKNYILRFINFIPLKVVPYKIHIMILLEIILKDTLT